MRREFNALDPAKKFVHWSDLTQQVNRNSNRCGQVIVSLQVGVATVDRSYTIPLAIAESRNRCDLLNELRIKKILSSWSAPM